VQGVGFRRRTLEVAQLFSVSGLVRNLADGRVEVIVDGEEAAVRAFLAALGERLAANIASVDERERAPAEHREFIIAR
jgi:acylphosphatase